MYIILISIYGIILLIEAVLEMFFAKKCGARLHGLVWLPIGKEYVLGQLADIYDNKVSRRIYPIISGIYTFCFCLLVTWVIIDVNTDAYIAQILGYDTNDVLELWFVILGFLLLMNLVIYIYKCFVLYKIFCLKDKEHSVLWLVLFILLNFIHRFGMISYLIFLRVNMNKQAVPKSMRIQEHLTEEESGEINIV